MANEWRLGAGSYFKVKYILPLERASRASSKALTSCPPAHTTCYKLWVVGCSVWIMLFIPLSLTAFAMGLRPMRPTSPAHLTTDPIWLSSENQPVCQPQFPGHKAATGSMKKRASSILCIFNTSTQLRPYVSRMVLGYIPGLICKHVLYASITIPDPEGDLKSSTPEFDMECGGLDSVKILKKRFQHMKKIIPNDLSLEYYRKKTETEAVSDDELQQFLNVMKVEVYTVLSANTAVLETALFNLASGRLDQLAKLLLEWVNRFQYDGLFVSWSQPYAPDKSKAVFGTFADTFR
ncbi:hypothetical protein MRX96_027587 [Rhipicephalus microplus]